MTDTKLRRNLLHSTFHGVTLSLCESPPQSGSHVSTRIVDRHKAVGLYQTGVLVRVAAARLRAGLGQFVPLLALSLAGCESRRLLALERSLFVEAVGVRGYESPLLKQSSLALALIGRFLERYALFFSLLFYEVSDRISRYILRGCDGFFHAYQILVSIEKGLPHMNLADSRLKELDNPSLTENQRVLLRCRLAAEFIHTGQYDTARETLGGLWQGVGVRPNVEGIEQAVAAEVLLQVGALSGWIGASRQVAGAQEKAKDLISESASLLERAGELNRADAARNDLALCYWREGAYDEARVILEGAYARVTDAELKAKIVLRLIIVETCAGRYTDALRLLTESAPLFDQSTNDALRGRFHNERAIVLRKLGTAERRTDYFDRAILEYTAAIYHYELARHERYKATNENNLAFLLHKLGRYVEAHEYLDRARRTLTRLNDAGLLAQVDETRARVLIAEQKYREANRIIAGAIQTLEKGGESALLADALTVQGVAWARLGVHESSINILRRAMSMAEESGALSNAGLAALALIEEHGAKRLPQPELYNLYSRADNLLRNTQDGEEIARLRACARIALTRLSGARLHDKGFTFYGAIRDLEAKYIEQALEETEGIITRAAKLLGIRYQSLDYILHSRHKRLLKKRTPAQKRGRGIFKKKM